MIRVEIRCDGCNQLGATDEGKDRNPPHIMRRWCRVAGWRCDEKGDRCPMCFKKKKERRAEP